MSTGILGVGLMARMSKIPIAMLKYTGDLDHYHRLYPNELYEAHDEKHTEILIKLDSGEMKWFKKDQFIEVKNVTDLKNKGFELAIKFIRSVTQLVEEECNHNINPMIIDKYTPADIEDAHKRGFEEGQQDILVKVLDMLVETRRDLDKVMKDA